MLVVYVSNLGQHLVTLLDFWKHFTDILLMLSLRVCSLLIVSTPGDLLGEKIRHLLHAFLRDLLTNLCKHCPLWLELAQGSLDHMGQGRLLISLRLIHHDRDNRLFNEVKRKRCLLLYLPRGTHFTNL